MTSMDIAAVKLLIAALVFATVSVVCYVVSLLGNTWWIIENDDGTKTTQGLWGRCVQDKNSTQCFDRTNVLHFQEKKGTDPIIICLLLSLAFTLLTIIFGLSLICCCRNKAIVWQKIVKWITSFCIISFVSGIDAMLYIEFDILDNNTRGWSYMVALSGAGLQFILLALVVLQLCLRTRDRSNMHGWY